MDNSADTAMSLSREIIVLDFGDEGTNPYDFDKPSKSSLSNGNCKILFFVENLNSNVFCFSDRLQAGCCELAGNY